MSKIMQKEIDEVKKLLFSLGTLVEENLQKAMTALENRDPKLAGEIIESDKKIDDLEVQLEEDCLKILALHQPVAFDLRYIIAILKINNDLERIGDLAVNISKRVIYLSKQNLQYFPLNFKKMGQKVQEMVKKSLDALAEYDAKRAIQVCQSDDEIDQINRETYNLIIKEMPDHPDQFENFLACLSISRYLERIGDNATNIAEDVIYLVQGDIIRHKGDPASS